MLSTQFHNRGRNLTILQLLFILTCAAILFSACAPSAPPVPTATPVVIDLNQLYANPWTLVAFGDPANPTVVQQGLVLTAEFTPDGQVSGFGGCNTFSGTVQAGTDGTMTVGPLSSTLMACPEGMEQETVYLTALQSTKSFGFGEAGRLEIKYGDGADPDRVMVFSVGEKPLVGTNWVLVSMGDPAAPEAVAAGTVITAVLSPDGFVSGISGCNQYNASYTLEGDQITLGPVASTQMACPSGMEAEQAYLQALETAQQVEITGQKLTITYNEGTEVLTYTSASLPLTYTVWTLVMMNEAPVPAETTITAMFTPAETPDTGNISGSSGCNTYNAGYTLSGDSLTVQPASVTMMACSTGMDMEQSYLQALQASTAYEIIADTLILTSSTGSLTYTANRTPLSGALWTLVALGDVNNPEPPVPGSRFAAQFSRVVDAPSGILTGTTGCNEYSAAYAASIEEIKINPPSGTQNKSCAPGLSEQEELYFLALNDATNYRISGNTLILPYDDDKQALVFEGTQLESAERPPLTELNNTSWHLWYINNAPLVLGTAIYGQFVINADGASGTMSGSAGCNNYVASFGQDLGVQTTLTARQLCSEPAGVMDQEGNYINMLSRAFGYWQTGDQLILNTGLGVLTYRSAPPPESFDQTHLLVGPLWYLVSYRESYSEAGDHEPFTQFNSNGTLTGYTGCNNFQGTYTTSVQNITITNLTWERINCPNSTLDAQEEAMLDILRTARDYQVVETVMQIVGASGALNYSLTPLNRPDEVELPTAAFSGPTDVPAGQAATFDGTSSGGPVPIVYWEWDFGDGSTGTGPIADHVFASPGSLRVRLTVTDQRGYQDTEEKTVNVTTPAQPTAAPTQPPAPTPTAQPTTAPTESPEATATVPPTQEPAPTEPPATERPEIAPLPVLPPEASIQGPNSGYVGEPVTFDASGSTSTGSSIASYTWNFGDGTTAGPSTDPLATTIYNQTGTYQVSVIVTDENNQSSEATMAVTIGTRLGTPTVWLLDPTLPGTAITLEFLAGQITGFAGCNSYNGGYTAAPNEDGTYTVTMTGLTNTGMACPGDIMQQEQNYLSTLSGVTAAQIQGNVLILDSPQGSLTYYQAGTPRP